MKAIVFGATGGSGRAAVSWLLSAGHEVSAFVRKPPPAADDVAWDRVRLAFGDVMDPDQVRAAVAGHDAVVVALGISENPFLVRMRGPAHTPMTVRSAGTRNVVNAMRAEGIKRLVVQTTYGLGETRERLRFVDKALFDLVLKPQIDDTEQQEAVVTQSDLAWTLIRPVHLVDAPETALPHASCAGDIANFSVSRQSVGRYLAHAAATSDLSQRTVALSGAAP